MKFKNLFDIRNIKRFVIAAIVLFLALPIIVPQKKAIKIIKKEISTDREESPLPIFVKETPLQKYINRFKNFYGFEKEPVQSITEEEEETPSAQEEVYAEDLFFSYDDDENDVNKKLFARMNPLAGIDDDSVNLQKGTVITSSGMVLEPTQEGYYYQGKFYKNGTYPPNADKQEIELALNNYHSAIAKYNDKKALYVADKNGNLTVDYVNQYPDKMAENIDKYFANNPLVTNQTTNAAPTKSSKVASTSQRNNNQRYAGAHINGNSGSFQNTNVNMSDIALASLHDMHSAYDLASAKIKSGTMGSGIDIEKPNNPNNPNNNGYGNINNMINQLPSAENPYEELQDNMCKGDECDNAIMVTPEMKNGNLDLDSFYKSFCVNQQGGCVTREAFFQDLPAKISGNDIEELLEKLANSEETMVEIAYIHPDKEYLEVLQQLASMGLKNKNGEDVQIKLRSIQPFAYNGQDNTGREFSFAEKLLGPISQNVYRDFAEYYKEGNDDPIQDIMVKYNKLYYETQRFEDAKKRSSSTYKINFRPDYAVAIVEKDPDDNNTFIVNSPSIPGGYKNEIEQWKGSQYEQQSEFGPYYKVPKEEFLKNAPSDVAIIFAKKDESKDEMATLPNGHPVTNVSISSLRSLNYDDVKNNAINIYDAQLATANYNAEKSGQSPRDWMEATIHFPPMPVVSSVNFLTTVNPNLNLNLNSTDLYSPNHDEPNKFNMRMKIKPSPFSPYKKSNFSLTNPQTPANTGKK